MINSLLTAIQLLLIVFSLSLVLYNLMIGDNKRSTYIGLLLNSCLLWLVLI